MLRQLEPSSGVVEIGSRTEINYVDQNRLLLDDAKTVWEEVGEGSEYVRLGEENITLRGYLRRFLFTEERINTKIDQLSGGERSRVLLAKILKRGGNVLILDEPTNDLDLGTLRLLEEALVAFGGSVIVVSHDRYFLNRVCTAILAFEGDGDVHYGVGNYDYYLEKRSARSASMASETGSEQEHANRGDRLGKRERKDAQTEMERATGARRKRGRDPCGRKRSRQNRSGFCKAGLLSNPRGGLREATSSFAPRAPGCAPLCSMGGTQSPSLARVDRRPVRQFVFATPTIRSAQSPSFASVGTPGVCSFLKCS